MIDDTVASSLVESGYTIFTFNELLGLITAESNTCDAVFAPVD